MGNEKKNRKKMETREKRRDSSTGATIDCHKLVAHDVRVAVAVAVVLLQQELYLQRDFIYEFDELQPKDTSS